MRLHAWRRKEFRPSSGVAHDAGLGYTPHFAVRAADEAQVRTKRSAQQEQVRIRRSGMADVYAREQGDQRAVAGQWREGRDGIAGICGVHQEVGDRAVKTVQRTVGGEPEKTVGPKLQVLDLVARQPVVLRPLTHNEMVQKPLASRSAAGEAQRESRYDQQPPTGCRAKRHTDTIRAASPVSKALSPSDIRLSDRRVHWIFIHLGEHVASAYPVVQRTRQGAWR